MCAIVMCKRTYALTAAHESMAGPVITERMTRVHRTFLSSNWLCQRDEMVNQNEEHGNV